MIADMTTLEYYVLFLSFFAAGFIACAAMMLAIQWLDRRAEADRLAEVAAGVKAGIRAFDDMAVRDIKR